MPEPEPGGGAGGATPIFGRSVNPIPIGGGQIMPPNYYWHPKKISASGITAISIVRVFEQPQKLIAKYELYRK